MSDVKYYESHVTIEPVFGPRLEKFEELAKAANFRVAKLLMQKDRIDTLVRSDKDSFCTGHSVDKADLFARMDRLVATLREAGFDVWRAKIEAVIHDERFARKVAV